MPAEPAEDRIVIENLYSDLVSVYSNWLLTHILADREPLGALIQALPERVAPELFGGLADQKVLTLPLKKYLERTGEAVVQAHLHGSATRTFFSELYELLHDYCRRTAQVEALAKAPWKNMLRLLRNATSHRRGGSLHAWPADLRSKGIMTISYAGLILRETELGRPIQFPPDFVQTLWYDIVNWVLDNLR